MGQVGEWMQFCTHIARAMSSGIIQTKACMQQEAISIKCTTEQSGRLTAIVPFGPSCNDINNIL